VAKRPLWLKIEGADELGQALEAIAEATPAILREAVEFGADYMLRMVQQAAPGPGIQRDVVKADAQRYRVAIGPDRAHWYYRFFEYGAEAHEMTGDVRKALAFGDKVRLRVKHPGMAARPFLRSTFDAQQKTVVDMIGRRVGELVEEEVRRRASR
jgi:HK97 gp10 family phage protein